MPVTVYIANGPDVANALAGNTADWPKVSTVPGAVRVAGPCGGATCVLVGTDVGASVSSDDACVEQPATNAATTARGSATRRICATVSDPSTLRKVVDVSTKQGQVVAHGAFQLFGARRAAEIGELLSDVFGRTDVDAVGADWRGIVYFTIGDDDELASDTVVGFDPSSGSSGPLTSVDEVLAAVRSGEIADAVDVASFDAWRTATGMRSIDMGSCVPPAIMEFMGGDPAERSTEPQDLITFIAVSAALMGRMEALGVRPGDEIPDEVFDESQWE